MLLVVNDMADVRHAVVEAIKKAKELAGYEGDIKVVDAVDALTEEDDIVVGLGVKGYDYMTLSPKQIVTRGASITFLTQTFINAMADHGQAKRLDEGVNYFVVDKVPLHMLSETGPVALDIETGGDSDKEPWATGELLSIALYDGRNAYVIPTELCETQTTAEFISALCDKRPVICHMGTYDMGYLSARLGIKVYHHDDTLLMHYALYNTAGEHGLKPLARRWLNAPDWDSANAKYLKGGAHYENIPREQLYLYNAYDVYWTFQLYMLFAAMLDERPALRDFYEHRMEIAHTMQDVQANGVLVDEEKLKEIGVKCSQDAEDALAWLCAAVGRNDFNPASTKQLKEELQAMYGVQLVSTDSEHLNDLAYDVPETAEFIENLFKYRQAKKLKGTYVDGILSKVGKDGKVHPTYLLHGTKSGRLSSKNPNWQNAPRGADIKKAYVAAPGQKIICCDYSQAELRTVAELSNDENMMAAFQPGAPDFFDNLMTKIYPDEFPTIADYEKFDRENHGAAKDKRATVKGTVYGSNYGRGVPAIAKSLKVPVEQAQSVMDAYYSAYPKLKVWQDSVRESVGNDALGYRTTTPFGLQFKQEVITYKNRHKVGNEALAFVPQSTAAEICLRATVQINKRVGAYGAQVIGSIHDACYVMAPEEHVDKVAHMMETEMHGAAQLVFHRVPFVAEAEIGDNCGEV